LTSPIFAQSNALFCGFHPSAAYLAQYDAEMNRLNSGNAPEQVLTDIPWNASIPIYFWINKSNSANSQDAFTLSKAVERVNLYFHFPNNAHLTFCGVSYINDPRFYMISETDPQQNLLMFNTYRKEHAINVYIPEVDPGLPFALGPDFGSKIVLQQVGVNNGSNATMFDDILFAHELGHVFGLLHTFNDIEPNNPELVVRADPNRTKQFSPNWSTAGDRMESTPADFFDTRVIHPNCHATCPYSCPFTDANGDSYAPDIGNLMSYHYCYNYSTMHFTQEQQTKMTLKLQTELDFLINASCTESIANVGSLARRRYASETTDECYSLDGTTYDATVFAKNASISIQNSANGAVLCPPIASDNTSSYKSCNLIGNSSITIVPTKNTNYLENVTTLDIAYISRHILGLVPFTHPYQMLAADVDNSGDIGGADMLILRRMILRQMSVFPNNVGSWRFVPNYFLNQPSFESVFKTDPFAASYQGYCYDAGSCGNSYMDKVTLDMSTDEAKTKTSWSFAPFKVGDVTYCNSTYTSATGGVSVNSARVANNYQLRTARPMSMRRTEEKTIVLKSKTAASVMSMQIGLNFLKDKFKIKEIEKGDFESANDVFDFSKEDKGELRVLWFNKRGKAKNFRVGTVLLKAKVKADANIDDILTVLNLDDQILKTEFYDESGNIVPMELEWDNADDDNATTNGGIVVNAFPNPFRNEVSLEINSPVAESATITISNIITGQRIVIQRQLLQGANVVNINNTSSLSAGMLTYSIVVGRRIVNGTITKTR
jgi:hypothetical protein